MHACALVMDQSLVEYRVDDLRDDIGPGVTELQLGAQSVGGLLMC